MSRDGDSLSALVSSAQSYARLARSRWRDRQLAQGEAGWGVPPQPPMVLPPDAPASRVAIVGAGVQGLVLARATQALTGAELVGIADLRNDRRDAASQQLGLEADVVVPDAQELFDTRRVDLAIVATTAPSHSHLGHAALEAGVPRVLIEKPIDSSYSAAAALARSAGSLGAYLAVDYSRRWLLDHRAIVSAVADGQIGEPRFLFASIGAGQLGMHASHMVDLARMVLRSDPVEVTARLSPASAPNSRGVDFDDPTGHLSIRFASGARAVIDFEEDLTQQYGVVGVRGEDGLILLEERLGEWCLRARSGRMWTFPLADPFRPHSIATRTLLGVLTEAAPSCSAADGLAALEVVLGAMHSDASGGRPVALPLTEEQRALTPRLP